MVDTIRTRRTHYDVLGLEPTATSAEIERAFAGSISIFQPHGFSGVADAAVAFRTLRDPARRRAYDTELGLRPAPEPRASPMQWQVGAQFLNASQMWPRTVEPHVEPEAPPAIAEALRKLASPEPLHATPPVPERPALEPRPQRPPEAKAAVEADPPAAGARIVHLALNGNRDEGEASSVPWKPIGIAAGAVIVAGAIIGGWAGWDASSATEPPASESAKAVLPPPTTYTVSDPAATAPNVVLDARPLPSKRAVRPATRVAHARPTSQLADVERQLSEPQEPAPAQVDAAGQSVETAPATVSAASLPLPNRVIARTLARIGYPCGQVASSAPAGASGVFNVTCTSGHSYQAAPVRGRYHFRRL